MPDNNVRMRHFQKQWNMITSSKPALVKTRIRRAMYWSVSFSVSGGRSGCLFSPMRSGKFRGLRYTAKHVTEFYDIIVRSLTRQPTSIDEGLVPLRGLDVEKVEEHVEDDFLHFREYLGSHRECRRTLVSRDGIRNVLTMDLIALWSSMQKYISPTKVSAVSGSSIYITNHSKSVA